MSALIRRIIYIHNIRVCINNIIIENNTHIDVGTHGTVKNAVNYGRNDNEVRCCVENINTVVDIKKTTTDTRSK